ncbi:MAG: GIY-YIG nuclease family protein [Ignavibacteria bacterium]|nr:GIY-YIG nuclease family protein [Ignavibacteria bacterium]
MKQFSQAVCEKIGYYVYIVKDPRNSTIFYVGMGTGNRIFQHVSGAIMSPATSDKVNLIRKIHDDKLKVEHFILRHGITETSFRN